MTQVVLERVRLVDAELEYEVRGQATRWCWSTTACWRTGSDRATPGRGIRRGGRVRRLASPHAGHAPAARADARRAPYVAPLKTPASYRTVPLPAVVVDSLTAHLATFPAVKIELLDMTSKPTARRRPASLIFTTSAGLPIRRTRFSDVWRTAANAAGLPAGASFHDHASLRIQHGESVKVVQKRLGHKSAVETLDTYSHLWPDSEDRTREAVDAVLGRCAAAGAVTIK